MFRGPLQPSRPGRPSRLAPQLLPAEVPQSPGSARSPRAPCDDDLERRRREMEVYRFLIALYPQLR